VQATEAEDAEKLIDVWSQCIRDVEQATAAGEPKEQVLARYDPFIKAREQLAGDYGLTIGEVLDHVVGRFGPPCSSCGKNLRTPKSKTCFECGTDSN
jgi:hypothetical protein